MLMMMPTCWDHPRIRGEHDVQTPSAATFQGSSPHTRGARAFALAQRDEVGIIPAYAGSTPRSRGASAPSWDHPRIRGEHYRGGGVAAGQEGSSPHTRGAPIADFTATTILGIIPAYAGSTTSSSDFVKWSGDHPRIRGEHRLRWETPRSFLGSSPHTRGARINPRTKTIHAGIIPAYAGSTTNYDS